MDPVTSTPQQSLSDYNPPVDASKYIRTYAKDVAVLTNTPIPVSSPKPQPSVLPGVSGKSTESGVTVQEFDSSPVSTTGADVSPREFKQEDVSLSASDSEGIFSDKDRVSANTAQTVPETTEPISFATSAFLGPATSTDEDREAVLARLRAKLATHQAEVPKAVAPEPLATVAPILEATPTSSTIVAPAPLPTPSIEVPEFIPPRPIVVPQQSASPLHTYTSDFADHIDQQNSSTFSVLAAQSDAEQSQSSSSLGRTKRSFIPLAAGVVMLVIGIGAVAGAYILTRSSSTSPIGISVPSLIRFDESVEIKGTGSELMSALSRTAQGASVSGNVIVTYVTGPNATSTTGIAQPGGVLIKALSLPAPDILLRNIDESSTVGTIRAGSESRPFFILKASSYERTFAGMLAWEQTMGQDLAILYPEYSSLPQDNASTSPTMAPSISRAPVFTDAVVANHTVRILRDDSGRSLVLYGYRGKDILIIARDEASFTQLLSRIATQGN